MEAVLPRIRSRRKRWRPPTPLELVAMFSCALNVGNAATVLVCAAVRDIPHGDAVMLSIEACALVLASFYLWACWPIVANYFATRHDG